MKYWYVVLEDLRAMRDSACKNKYIHQGTSLFTIMSEDRVIIYSKEITHEQYTILRKEYSVDEI